MSRSLVALIALAFVAAIADAQIAYVLTNTGAGFSQPVALPTSGFPIGGPDGRGPLPLPFFAASGAPLNPAPAGGHAIDQVAATVYSSDGMILQIESHGLYGPAGGAPPVPVFGMLPGGPFITGLGVDSAPGGFLYMCNATSFQARMKVPPFAPAGPIITPAFPHAPFSGLGYETATGSLWLCDVGGAIYHLTLAGLPIGAQPVALRPSAVGLPMVGLDVNSSVFPGAFPEPACSTALAGYRICVTDGVGVYDAFAPAVPPIPVPAIAVGPGAYGLAFSSDAQDLGGAGVCMTTGATLVNDLNRPAVVGAIPGPVTAITCSGLVPFGAATLWIDLCPVLGGIPVPGAGILHINPFAPPVVAGALANGAGVASVTLPFALAPANVTFACQWYAFDALNAPTFICLSNGVVVTTGLP